jgi:predicted NAD/FAD-dependent oxidoreductase
LRCDEEQQKITAIELSNGSTATFDKYILAVPFPSFGKILESSQLDTIAETLQLDRFELGAITTIHLWLDRPLVKESQPFSMLLGGIGQFLCQPQHGANNDRPGYYHTVVVSASHRLLSDRELAAGQNEPLANRILGQLRATFCVPALQLRYHRITTNFEAVFCPGELIFENRPAAQTQFDNLTLAGDWTQTGLPATMEGAVVSGINAVPE